MKACESLAKISSIDHLYLLYDHYSFPILKIFFDEVSGDIFKM
jgi:hypothetical protein